QEEDGIRCILVTVFQTYSLPIYHLLAGELPLWEESVDEVAADVALLGRHQRSGVILQDRLHRGGGVEGLLVEDLEGRVAEEHREIGRATRRDWVWTTLTLLAVST